MHNPAIRRRIQAVLCALGVIAIDLVTKLATQIDKRSSLRPGRPRPQPELLARYLARLTGR